jgi:hypothetical protein
MCRLITPANIKVWKNTVSCIHRPLYSISIVTALKSRNMSLATQFPPQAVRQIVAEVAALLKERKETVSVAETVRQFNAATRYALIICSRQLEVSFRPAS